jgi:hypothetical protein
MATNLTHGALTFVNVGIGGYYEVRAQRPDSMNDKDLLIHNTAYRGSDKDLLIHNTAYRGSRQTGTALTDRASEIVEIYGIIVATATWPNTAAAEVNLNTVIANICTVRKSSSLIIASLVYASPMNSGIQRTLTNMKFADFDLISPPTIRHHDSSSFQQEFRALFVRYGA